MRFGGLLLEGRIFGGAYYRSIFCSESALLSTFTHTTYEGAYKGALSRGFCCVQVNCVLNERLALKNCEEEIRQGKDAGLIILSMRNSLNTYSAAS